MKKTYLPMFLTRMQSQYFFFELHYSPSFILKWQGWQFAKLQKADCKLPAFFSPDPKPIKPQQYIFKNMICIFNLDFNRQLRIMQYATHYPLLCHCQKPHPKASLTLEIYQKTLFCQNPHTGLPGPCQNPHSFWECTLTGALNAMNIHHTLIT